MAMPSGATGRLTSEDAESMSMPKLTLSEMLCARHCASKGGSSKELGVFAEDFGYHAQRIMLYLFSSSHLAENQTVLKYSTG